MKYKHPYKVQAVRYVIAGNSEYDAGTKFKVSRTTINKWVRDEKVYNDAIEAPIDQTNEPVKSTLSNQDVANYFAEMITSLVGDRKTMKVIDKINFAKLLKETVKDKIFDDVTIEGKSKIQELLDQYKGKTPTA